MGMNGLEHGLVLEGLLQLETAADALARTGVDPYTEGMLRELARVEKVSPDAPVQRRGIPHIFVGEMGDRIRRDIINGLNVVDQDPASTDESRDAAAGLLSLLADV